MIIVTIYNRGCINNVKSEILEIDKLLEGYEMLEILTYLDVFKFFF